MCYVIGLPITFRVVLHIFIKFLVVTWKTTKFWKNILRRHYELRKITVL